MGADKPPKPSSIGRGLLSPIIWTNQGESTNPDDYRKPNESVVEAKTLPIPKPAPRGMTSRLTTIDDLGMFPPEELIFEMKNVKFWRVRFVKGEDGYYHGPLLDGDLYAIDVDCDGRMERIAVAITTRHREKPNDVAAALKHAIASWRSDGDKIHRYFPNDVRCAVLDHLHADASAIAKQLIGGKA